MQHLFAYINKEQGSVDKADYVDNIYTVDNVDDFDDVENFDEIYLAVTRTLQKTRRVVVHL